MKKILVVAPHADDESLGCGGTILKHISEGDEVHWLLVTGMSTDDGYNENLVRKRSAEINKVAKCYGFKSTIELMFPPASLEEISKKNIISQIGSIVNSIEPEVVYTVYRNDAHSDHAVVYDSVIAATKSFRYPFIRRILAYETMSETDFGLKPEDGGFKPNVYINITNYLETKLNIIAMYKSEIGDFPFPRSREALEALAKVRGVQCSAQAAEAFMLIKEINT